MICSYLSCVNMDYCCSHHKEQGRRDDQFESLPLTGLLQDEVTCTAYLGIVCSCSCVTFYFAPGLSCEPISNHESRAFLLHELLYDASSAKYHARTGGVHRTLSVRAQNEHKPALVQRGLYCD